MQTIEASERILSVVSGMLPQEYLKKNLKKKQDLEQLKIEKATERKLKNEENSSEKELLKKVHLNR